MKKLLVVLMVVFAVFAAGSSYAFEAEKVTVDVSSNQLTKFGEFNALGNLDTWNVSAQFKLSLFEGKIGALGIDLRPSYDLEGNSDVPFAAGVWVRPFGIKWLEPYYEYKAVIQDVDSFNDFTLDGEDLHTVGVRLRFVDR